MALPKFCLISGPMWKKIPLLRYYVIFLLVFAKVSVAVIKYYDQKQPREEKDYLACNYTSQSIIEGSHSRNLGTGYEREAMEVCYKPTCFFWLAQVAFLYIPGPPAKGRHCLQ